MTERISWLGLGFVAFGLFVLLAAIPYAVTSPSNVPKLVLAPTFWPTIVAWMIIGLGALLTLLRLVGATSSEATDADDDAGPGDAAAWLRLAGAVGVMIALVYVTPVLGMVWTAMLAFVGLSVLARSSRPVMSAVVAILLPLALYGFFAHIAGVAVPQGEFVQLP